MTMDTSAHSRWHGFVQWSRVRAWTSPLPIGRVSSIVPLPRQHCGVYTGFFPISQWQLMYSAQVNTATRLAAPPRLEGCWGVWPCRRNVLPVGLNPLTSAWQGS